MRNTLLFHVWALNIYYGTSSTIYLIMPLFPREGFGISEGDIKGFVFQHNSEVYKFISAAVDLYD